MKYQLIENYFETDLFQIAVQDYFDTVLGKIISGNASLPAKGLFKVNGEVKRDYYDMPYHIHILNGLIPALFVYEKYLLQNDFIESPEMDTYLRVFILGFTFHDANKLLQTKQTGDFSDLEIAVAQLDDYVELWNTHEFFPEFDTHKSTIYYLALSTEDGTWSMAEDYPISVNNWKHIREIQRELCHLADGLASIQNEHLESIEALYKAVSRSLDKISRITDLQISYVKVRPNPYTLLSQNLLQVARMELAKRGKKVLYAMREGFIYWGEDLNEEEFEIIEKRYLSGSEGDIKVLELTKIDFQKCKFGFVGSTPFTQEILSKIVEELDDKFLALSPNRDNKIDDFEGFCVFTKKLIDSYRLPVEDEVKNGKLILRYSEKIEDEFEEHFKIVFNLHKIQWLNAKENKAWKADFDSWTKKKDDLFEPIEFEIQDTMISLKNIPDILFFIESRVNSTNALYKTYLNFIKTISVLEEVEDIEDYIANLHQEIIDTLEVEQKDNHVKQQLFNRYFECKGNVNLHFLENYNPTIPAKKEMCVFTAAKGGVTYKAEVAFAMKARGFSNRTITALNYNSSHISSLFAEENKLRASQFKVADANFVIYHDFFEAKLDIDKDIIHSCLKAKNELKLLKDGTIEFDKSAKFQYNLYNLEFVKLAPKVEPIFYFVRKCIRVIQQLGIRSHIAGIMTPYTPHKAAFHFENAPKFLIQLGWHDVRLGQLEEVLDEINLILTFGKSRLESNLLRVAKSRSAYFRLFYELNEKHRKKVSTPLFKFYEQYKTSKFQAMTITEELVKLAVQIDLASASSASETWLIRTATEYLRRYVKQGKSREDVIQKICGEINRKLRMQNPNPDAIEAFATAVYDKLYLKDWGSKIPTINSEKDWVYQFAFLYTKASKQEKHLRSAKRIKRELEVEGKTINEANVKAKLSAQAKKYVNEYLETIQNL